MRARAIPDNTVERGIAMPAGSPLCPAAPQRAPARTRRHDSASRADRVTSCGTRPRAGSRRRAGGRSKNACSSVARLDRLRRELARGPAGERRSPDRYPDDRSDRIRVPAPHGSTRGAGPRAGRRARAAENVLSAISNEMVRLYKEQFGRGPTKTRTNWAGPDMLVVTLEQTFTPAERSLQRMGEHQRLRDLRLLFQYAEVDDVLRARRAPRRAQGQRVHQRHRHAGRPGDRDLRPAPARLRRPVARRRRRRRD